LWKALLKGDNSRIYNISFPLSSFISILTSLDAFLTIEKYILVKRGIFINNIVRKPCNYKLDHETIKEVDLIFSKLMKALDSDDK
jgi:4-hydroxy-tetrahydrodipicolinate synthase